MYKLSPPAVYAHESVVADPRYKERLDRVVEALATPVEVTVYADDDLPAMIAEKQLTAGCVPMGTLKDIPDPILLFNTFRFDGRGEERMEWLRGLTKRGQLGEYQLTQALLGYGPFCWFENDSGKVCRNCWRLHFQAGCAHKCHYCSLGGLLVTMVNVEDYIERLDRLIELNPWQETYLLEDDAEVPCLEPELGCLGPIIEHFGTLRDRYLIIHTKSANVDWMVDLAHNGRTIVVWSVAGPTQAEAFEPVAASTAERIEAAVKLAEAGYTVRYKFKPIIPMREWRREAADTIRMVFERTDPDLISLCVFMWMDVNDMKSRLDASLLDPEYLAAAEQAVEEVKDSSCRPFPGRVRAEIYGHYLDEIRKHNPDIPVSLSTESPEVWKLMGGRLGVDPAHYVCGCGPNSTPKRRKLEKSAFLVAAGGPVGGFEKM